MFVAVTFSTAGNMVKVWVREAALWVLSAGADAVIEHWPTPLMTPLAVHCPDAVKLTGRPAEDEALNVNVLPYCESCNGAKLIVCDMVLEPCGRIMTVPDTASAALNALVPGCDAMMVQAPGPLGVTVAEETLLAID